MNVKPFEHQRTVLLSLQFAEPKPGEQSTRHTEPSIIGCISVLYADHDDISVEIFDDRNEVALLRRFWLSLRPGDQVFAADAEETLSLLRYRSWLLDVIPGQEVDLRVVYGVQVWDTRKMWVSGYAPRHLYVAAPMSPSEFAAVTDVSSEFVDGGD